jgi:hypothetical protein
MVEMGFGQPMPFLSATYMNGFARLFLNEDWAGLPDAPRVYLGAFGKHPGWNDHLDDLGLVTASLIDTRRILYSGVAHQIETAAWEKAGADKVAPGFDHAIHWRRPGESLTGLVWSSQDGKGRSLYPMIVVVQCVGQSFAWIADVVVPRLEAVAEKCRATASASAVIAALNDTQQNLRYRAPGLGAAPLPDSALGIAAWAEYCTHEPAILQRVLHHLRGQFALFAPGCAEWCENEKQAGSRSLRLPQIPGARPAESLNAWISFLATQVDPAVPILGLLPMDRTWVDVIVGEPAPADFFVLRALPAAVPLVTDIPYQLDAEMQASCAGLLADVARGHLPATSLLNGETVATNRDAAAKWLTRVRPNGRSGFFSRFLKPGSPPSA